MPEPCRDTLEVNKALKRKGGTQPKLFPALNPARPRSKTHREKPAHSHSPILVKSSPSVPARGLPARLPRAMASRCEKIETPPAPPSVQSGPEARAPRLRTAYAVGQTHPAVGHCSNATRRVRAPSGLSPDCFRYNAGCGSRGLHPACKCPNNPHPRTARCAPAAGSPPWPCRISNSPPPRPSGSSFWVNRTWT